jgi:hypothetical protein
LPSATLGKEFLFFLKKNSLPSAGPQALGKEKIAKKNNSKKKFLLAQFHRENAMPNPSNCTAYNPQLVVLPFELFICLGSCSIEDLCVSRSLPSKHQMDFLYRILPVSQ